MFDTSQRYLSIRSCCRGDQHFLLLLRALVAGPAWRSQAIHELEGLGVRPDSSFVLVALMEAIQRHPHINLLGPQSSFVSPDELNLLTALRLAYVEADAVPASPQDLGFLMPETIPSLLSLSGRILRDTHIKIACRPMINGAAQSVFQGGVAHGAIKADTRDTSKLRKSTVISNISLSRSWRRITLAGIQLSGLSDMPPAQWVKVFPCADERLSGHYDPGVGRVYTVRDFDPHSNTLTLDVGIHGHGAVSSRLEAMSEGAPCYVAGPRGGFEGTPADCTRLVIAGDSAALPAIAGILDSLPPEIETRAFVSVEDISEAQAVGPRHNLDKIVWFSARQGQLESCEQLRSALLAWCSPMKGVYVWAAGEAGLVRSLRRDLRSALGFAAARVHTVGYWKRGETDHRDASAG